ncbi:MAG: adenylate/guanylate cyclase domain-containing protein, partial [Candidatus Nitrosopelagicus sp.]
PQEILIGEDVYNRIHPTVQKEFSKKVWNEEEWKYHSRETGELYPVYYHTKQ